MPAYTTDDIRNVALTGHGGAGKTTLAEALLAYAGVIGAPGSVTNGSSVCDFDAQEKEHQHSLYTAVANFDHGSRHVNLVDTPGYPDFLGRALPVLAAVETAAVVVDARQGVQMVTRRMMEAAAERGLARLVVVNKIDAEELDLETLLESLVEAFGTECMPINLPADGGPQRGGLLLRAGGRAGGLLVGGRGAHPHRRPGRRGGRGVDGALPGAGGRSWRRTGSTTRSSGHCAKGHLIPVCFTSAEQGTGIPELANVIEKKSCRARWKRIPPRFAMPRATQPQIAPDADGPARRSRLQDLRGRLRVASSGCSGFTGGTVTKDSQLHVGDARKPVKVGHLFALQGKEHVEIDAGVPGDICAVAKIDEVVLRRDHARVPERRGSDSGSDRACPRRCWGSRSRPGPAATSRSSETRSRSSRRRIRAWPSSTTRYSTRR